MVVDQANYEIEGFDDQVATHSVRIEEIRSADDGSVEADLGVLWEPDRTGANETGTPQYLSPTAKIYVNGTEVGETGELDARSSFHATTTVQIPDANPGDTVRFVAPQNYEPVYTYADIEGTAPPKPFSADRVSATCTMSRTEAEQGSTVTLIASVTNDNDDPASVDVTWSIGDRAVEASGETVPANTTADIRATPTVTQSPTAYDVSLSIDVSEG